jgi:hypothetical protein
MLFFEFKIYVTSVEDAKYLGCPSASRTDENVDWMKEFGVENGRIIICEVGNMLGILYWVSSEIFKDNLNMCWIATKFVPYLLSKEQNDSCVNACQDD